MFLKIFRSISSYDPSKAAISTWIHRITVNHCLNWKTRYLWRLFPLDFSQESDPAQSPRDLEENQQLFEALSLLSPAQRTLVVLRYGWQLPFEEIAQIMGVPSGTVKSRHIQVIKVLQSYYQAGKLPAIMDEEVE